MASYKNYAQSKATVAKNTMPSAPKFESAYISPARQHSASAPKIRNLWNNRSNMPNISSRTTLGGLAEAYFDSMQKKIDLIPFNRILALCILIIFSQT